MVITHWPTLSTHFLPAIVLIELDRPVIIIIIGSHVKKKRKKRRKTQFNARVSQPPPTRVSVYWQNNTTNEIRGYSRGGWTTSIERRGKEKKKKRKNDFIRPIHSNSLSTRRISGVIRRYRARQDSWFPGESRHWNEISKRSNDILRYLKSLLCTSTSYERREGSWEWPRSFWIMGTIRSLDVREARRHCAPSLRGNRSIEGGKAKKLKAFRKRKFQSLK